MGSTGSDSTRALDRAKELTARGQYGEAVYYFTNALSHAPGDVGVVEAYTQSVLDSVTLAAQAGGDTYEPLQQLDWLEAFLVDQTAQVPCEHVPTLLSHVQDVQKRRSALRQDAPVEVDPEAEAMAGRLKKLQNGKLKFTVPGVNYIYPSPCLAWFATERALLPHVICYQATRGGEDHGG